MKCGTHVRNRPLNGRVDPLPPPDMCTSVPETVEEVESRGRLLRLLDLVIDALVWAISKLGLSTQEQTLRLGHLTMLLSHIRHVRYKRPLRRVHQPLGR